MTDEQRARINAAVAEHVMGWVRATWKETAPRAAQRRYFLRDPEQDGFNYWRVAPDDFEPYVDYDSRVPHYSTTWEGMGLVVEKMAERGFDFELRTFTEGVVAEFRDYEKPANDEPDGRAAVDPREGGAPLACALAALRAVGHDTGGEAT